MSLLQDVVHNGASLGFLPPVTDETAEAFWHEVIEEVALEKRVLLVARDGDTVVGSAQLALATRPNGLHRAEVQKVLVHSAYRQRGIAYTLMMALEESARTLGRTLLYLDTEEGSVAETLYAKCGYVRSGVIPQFALNTAGELVSTVVYYKVLS